MHTKYFLARNIFVHCRLDVMFAPQAHSRSQPGSASIPMIVTTKQEVRPMYAVSAMGAPPQPTIPRRK